MWNTLADRSSSGIGVQPSNAFMLRFFKEIVLTANNHKSLETLTFDTLPFDMVLVVLAWDTAFSRKIL